MDEAFQLSIINRFGYKTSIETRDHSLRSVLCRDATGMEIMITYRCRYSAMVKPYRCRAAAVPCSVFYGSVRLAVNHHVFATATLETACVFHVDTCLSAILRSRAAEDSAEFTSGFPVFRFLRQIDALTESLEICGGDR